MPRYEEDAYGRGGDTQNQIGDWDEWTTQTDKRNRNNITRTFSRRKHHAVAPLFLLPFAPFTPAKNELQHDDERGSTYARAPREARLREAESTCTVISFGERSVDDRSHFQCRVDGHV